MANKRTGPDFLDRISDNTHRTDGKKKLLDMMKKNVWLKMQLMKILFTR